jgi:tetratricopeptide (TPR) repeat protein
MPSSRSWPCTSTWLPIGEDVLAEYEQVLGENHPDALTSRNNLAYVYQDAGRLDEAIPLYERTLTGLEQVLGDSHPYTMAARGNLATTYRAVGRLSEAEALRGRAE